MSSKWKFTLLFVGLLLALELLIIWRPFEFNADTYRVSLHGAQPAGEITRDFKLAQTFTAKIFHIRRKQKSSIHWHNPNSLPYLNEPNCFAVRFGTYNRKNVGSIRVNWEQKSASQSWLTNVSELEGNPFVNFCPTSGLSSDAPFQLRIEGVDGKRGMAATVWLAKSDSSTPLVINGETKNKRTLPLRLAYSQHVSSSTILELDRGAFAASCLLSLGIAFLALLAIRKAEDGALPQ